MFENAVGINIIVTLLYCWVVIFCAQGPEKDTEAASTSAIFFLSTHAQIRGRRQCPSTRSRPCFRVFRHRIPLAAEATGSVYTSFFFLFFFLVSG